MNCTTAFFLFAIISIGMSYPNTYYPGQFGRNDVIQEHVNNNNENMRTAFAQQGTRY